MTVNPEFLAHTQRTPELFAALLKSALVPIAGTAFPKCAAIYVFYLDGEPVHVGRTRNLQKRLRGHVAKSHYSASFAFKRARAETGTRATYKKGEGRTELMADELFRTAFDRALAEVRGMSVRFLFVDDPIDQYLLELYAALELQTSLSEFDTH